MSELGKFFRFQDRPKPEPKRHQQNEYPVGTKVEIREHQSRNGGQCPGSIGIMTISLADNTLTAICLKCNKSGNSIVKKIE